MKQYVRLSRIRKENIIASNQMSTDDQHQYFAGGLDITVTLPNERANLVSQHRLTRIVLGE